MLSRVLIKVSQAVYQQMVKELVYRHQQIYNVSSSMLHEWSLVL